MFEDHFATDQTVWTLTCAIAATSGALAVYSLLRSRRRGFRARRAAMLSLILAIAVLGVATFGGLPPHRHEHYGFTLCASTLRGVYRFAVLEADMNSGRLPDDLSGMPPDGLTCGVVGYRQGVAAPGDYLYFGKGLTTATLSAKHVLACDRPGNHGSKYDLWVVYGDGRLKMVTRERLEQMIADLKAGVNPPRP